MGRRKLMDSKMKDRVESIHKDSTVVDAHFDLLSIVEYRRSMGLRKVMEKDFVPDFLIGGVDVVVSSIYVDDMFLPEMGLKKALDQISALYSEVDESPDCIAICRTYNDIIKSKAEGKIGILLSLEGVDPLTNDLNLLRIFFELGVRMVGLTWSRRNYAADGCHYYSRTEGKIGGLTDFGVELIRMAEDLGMLIDVSHLNDEGFWDVMNVSKRPVIASHSNCRALAYTPRNLTDEQIKALAERGGIIGMNACSSFTSDKDEEGDADHLAGHVDHIVKLTGVEHVGLGFDFCDILREMEGEKAWMQPRKNFDVIKGHKNIPEFTAALIKRGLSDHDIGLILGGNFLNLYSKYV